MQNQSFTRHSSRGFTLLETLVTVMLIGILGAIALPTWLTFLDTYRLKTSLDQVYWAMREAQSNAKRDKLTWQASFRDKNGVVQWAVHPATLYPDLAQWHNLESEVQLDSETTLEPAYGVREIQFDYLGSVLKPPLGRITLSSRRGGKAKRCVFVSTILGALRTAKDHSQPKTENHKKEYCY